MLDLAERIIKMTGSQSDISLIPYGEAYAEGFEDMYCRVPDISKVQRLIDWRPSRTLENIIQDVVDHQRGASAPETHASHARSAAGPPSAQGSPGDT